MSLHRVTSGIRRAVRRLIGVLGATLLATNACAQEIVILYTLGSPFEAHALLSAEIRAELLRSSDETPPPISPEYLDATDAAEERIRTAFARYLYERYVGREIAVAVAVGAPAARFLTSYAGEVFDGTPVILVDDEDYFTRTAVPAGALVSVPPRPRRTVELAARLDPSLRHIFIVAAAETNRGKAIDEDLRALPSTFDVRYVSEPSVDELLGRIRALPPSSMVLFDSLGPIEPYFDRYRMATQVAAAASAPVYTLQERDLGTAVIGGHVVSIRDVGAQIAQKIMRAQTGSNDFDRVAVLPGSFIVDSAAMDAHSLPRDRLPAATEERLQAPPIWRLYQGWIITLLIMVASQFMLIVAFLLRFIRSRKQRALLNEATQRFQWARIAGQVGFWQWDLETDEIIVESELQKLLGYRDSDSRPADWCSRIYRDDLEAVIDTARDHVTRQPFAFEVQHRIVDRNDSVRWFLSRGQVLFDRNDRAVRVVGTAIDITQRKREEDERDRVQAQLHEQRLELAHLARAAATGALSGALAHELKQPLSAILTNAQAGQRYLLQPNVPQAEHRAILADIESEAQRAGSIIRNLRNMLKPGEERLVPVKVQAIVHDVLTLVRSDLVARNIQVVVAPLSDLPPILGESIQLQQVLLNVINNACDALSSIDPRDRRITIVAEEKKGYVHISVADNGCGLGSGDPEEIFKSFVSTKPHGLGLGLSISRSIVEAHLGKIWAENNLRGGATIHIEFPTAASASVQSEDTASTSQPLQRNVS